MSKYVTQANLQRFATQLADAVSTHIQQIANKQDSSDDGLDTTNKTVVGAINELFASIQAITPHTVHVEIDGKGSCKFEYNGLTAYGNSVVVPNGSMVKITLIPDTTLGEDYVEWRNADGSTETTTVSKTITISSDTTLYAYTALSSYTFSETIQTREQLVVLPWGMNIKHLVYPRTVNPKSTATFMPPFSGKKIQSQNVTYRLLRYTSGNADEGSQFTYHFAGKDFVEAWKGYFIWHTNSEALSQLEFEDVKFADAPKDSQWVEYKLESNSNTDVISTQIATTIYGTLEDGRKTMGFASGKVWYPHENGNPLPAWRCVFALRTT